MPDQNNQYMRPSNFFITFVIGSILILSTHQAITFSSQPPAGYTGAPGDFGTCLQCHGGGIIPGFVLISFLPLNITEYLPDSTYDMEVFVDAKTPRYGFEVTALDTSKNMAGTFFAGANTTIVSSSPRHYVGHQNATSIRTWNFSWKAPGSQTGPITFYVAANAADSNLSSSGDNIYLSNLTIVPSFYSEAIFSTDQFSYCDGDSVIFVDHSMGNINSWQWSFGDGDSSTARHPKHLYSTPGTYNVNLTIANDSTSHDTTIQVIINPFPIAEAGNDVTICAGDTALLSGSGGDTYQWSNGQTNQNINVAPLSTDTFAVSVTDSNFCSANDQVVVHVNALPIVWMGQTDSIFCLADLPITLTGNPAGGVFSGTGVSNQMFSPQNAGIGTHTLGYTFTDSAGCSNTAELEVEVNSCVGIYSQEAEQEVTLSYDLHWNEIAVHFHGAFNGQVELSLFKANGELAQVFPPDLVAGKHAIILPSENAWPAGIYFLQCKIDGHSSRLFKLLKGM